MIWTTLLLALLTPGFPADSYADDPFGTQALAASAQMQLHPFTLPKSVLHLSLHHFQKEFSHKDLRVGSAKYNALFTNLSLFVEDLHQAKRVRNRAQLASRWGFEHFHDGRFTWEDVHEVLREATNLSHSVFARNIAVRMEAVNVNRSEQEFPVASSTPSSIFGLNPMKNNQLRSNRAKQSA